MRLVNRALFVSFAAVLVVSSGLAAADSKDLKSSPQVKAYEAVRKAVQAGDFEAYKKAMTKESAKKMDEQIKESKMDTKKGMEFLKAMEPADLRFTDLKVNGKKATLMATGKVAGEANKGTIELEQEDGQWKVASQSWTNAK